MGEFDELEAAEKQEDEKQEFNKAANALWQRGSMGQGTEEDRVEVEAALQAGDLTKAEHIVLGIEKVKHFKDVEKDYSEGNASQQDYEKLRDELKGNTKLGL